MNRRTIARWVAAAWLLPSLWLVGCSTDESATAAVDNDGKQLITFSVSTDSQEAATRGIPLNELDGEFGLFCAQYTDATWGDGQKLNFMYNEMVIGSGNTWTTSEGYFVPASPNKLKFFAYYPYYDDVTSDDAVLKMCDAETAYETPDFTYTMPLVADDQLDLMYAMSDQVQANAQGKLGTVHLNFHHLTTAISIAAKSTEPGTIKRVTLRRLYPQGIFEYEAGNVLRAKKSGAVDVYADLDMKVDNTDYKTADEGKTFMLILQPTKEVEGEDELGNPITTTVADMNAQAQLWVDFEAGGKTYTFKKSLADLGPALIASKNTLLRLSIEGLKRITVKAEIIDWEDKANYDGAVSDQPQLELEPLILDWDDDDDTTTTNITTGPQGTTPTPQGTTPTPAP